MDGSQWRVFVNGTNGGINVACMSEKTLDMEL